MWRGLAVREAASHFSKMRVKRPSSFEPSTSTASSSNVSPPFFIGLSFFQALEEMVYGKAFESLRSFSLSA